MNISATSTNSSQDSNVPNIIDELISMKPIKLDSPNSSKFGNEEQVLFDKVSHANVAEIHHQSIIFDHDKFANIFIPYYVYHCKNISLKSYDVMISALKMVVIDKKSIDELDIDDFDQHLFTVYTLMQHISIAYPSFIYQVKPEKSNFATFKDFMDGKPLYHDCLLNQPPSSLLQLLRICDIELIVRYLK